MADTVYLRCPLCQSDAKSLWPEVKVCSCQSCDLLFRYPASSSEDLQALYKTSWANPTEEIDETGATSSQLADIYVAELAKSLGRDDPKGLRILDYGAGRGAMLQSLMAAGVDVYGVEPFGFEFLRQSGYKAFRSLDELPKGILFDGAVSLDVVEHLVAPWEDYRKIKDLLAEDGWLYMATPNAGGINARFTRAGWREIVRRGHLFFFTSSTLKLTLAKSGYKNIERLRWFIKYGKGLAVNLLHWIFQALRIDGELRFLAFR